MDPEGGLEASDGRQIAQIVARIHIEINYTKIWKMCFFDFFHENIIFFMKLSLLELGFETIWSHISLYFAWKIFKMLYLGAQTELGDHPQHVSISN